MKKNYLLLTVALLATSIGFNIYQSKNKVVITHPTEYHFNVDQNGYDIYTEDMKKVGRINYGENPTLDSLIDKDNL